MVFMFVIVYLFNVWLFFSYNMFDCLIFYIKMNVINEMNIIFDFWYD